MEIKIKRKEKDELDIKLDGTSSDEIRKNIKENEEYEERGKKLIHKRKDETIDEVFGDLFETMIYYSPVIFILGIMLLGAIPTYYHVNDELLNPSNSTIGGINESIGRLSNIASGLILKAHDYGKQKPLEIIIIFFMACLYLFIYPIIKISYLLIKKYLYRNKEVKKCLKNLKKH